MKFINVRLLTGNFAEALAFWRDTVQLKMSFGDETMRYAYFETGDSGIELFGRDDFAQAIGEAVPVPAPVSHQAVLVFKVDNVDITYRELIARGATPIAEPQDRPAWGVRTAPFKAHDDYIVEVYTPLQTS